MRIALAMPIGSMPGWWWKRLSSVATTAWGRTGAMSCARTTPPNWSPRQAKVRPSRSSMVTEPRVRPSTSAEGSGSCTANQPTAAARISAATRPIRQASPRTRRRAPRRARPGQESTPPRRAAARRLRAGLAAVLEVGSADGLAVRRGATRGLPPRAPFPLPPPPPAMCPPPRAPAHLGAPVRDVHPRRARARSRCLRISTAHETGRYAALPTDWADAPARRPVGPARGLRPAGSAALVAGATTTTRPVRQGPGPRRRGRP